MQKDYASNLKLLMWIAGLVLMIACANIANFCGAWDAAEDGDERADGIGRDAYEDCSAAADGELAAGGNRRLAALAVSYGGARCC